MVTARRAATVRIQIDLNDETANRLIDAAVADRRPVPWQAEVLIRRGLGLTDPLPLYAKENRRATTPAGSKESVGCHDQLAVV